MTEVPAQASPTTDSEAVREDVARFEETITALRAQISNVIVGQAHVTDALLISLLVGGHCLITGMPGTAKTLLVKTLATALGLKFRRIQFTPDLMPGDVTGTDIIVEDTTTGARDWSFVEGPLFTNVLLADEINRTPPKTQAALLEAMQERSVTVRGNIRELQPPFLVLATQNPIELEGTYPLPEAQLDRFVFNVLLDHLDAEGELAVVNRFTHQMEAPVATPVTDAANVLRMQALVRQVPVAESVARYAVNLVRATRPDEPGAPEQVRKYVNFGASVRATMFLSLASKAHALLAGRFHVETGDIDAIARPVLRHRVLTNYFAEADGLTVDNILDEVLASLG